MSTAFSLDFSASVAATLASFAAASEAAIASRAWSAARSDVEAVGTRGWGGAFGMVACEGRLERVLKRLDVYRGLRVSTRDACGRGGRAGVLRDPQE